MTEIKHVVVIYTLAGGGHVKAAKSLKEVLETTGRYKVTLLNPYTELMPHLDLWCWITKRTSEDIYNKVIIGKGKTRLFCLGYYLGVLLNFKLVYKVGRRYLSDYFKIQQPDMVISVLPMLNRVIFDAVSDYRQVCQKQKSIQNVVLITDWTEYGRHIWFPKGEDYYAICGTEMAFERASAYKNLKSRVIATQGILLMPAFQQVGIQDKAMAKAALGLAPDKPVICILYGGQGSWRMQKLAQALVSDISKQETLLKIQVLFLCGHNGELAVALQQMQMPFIHQVVGFTDEVHRYLAATDIFVGKPGPGSVSEALHFGHYLLLDQTSALPQEMPVLKWAVESGAGYAFKKEKDFLQALSQLLERVTQETHSTQARPNLASVQIPSIIDNLLN